MPASFRPIFNGMHRQLRLGCLRLGQDWDVEVRPLALTPHPPKFIHIKDSKPLLIHEPSKSPAANQSPRLS